MIIYRQAGKFILQHEGMLYPLENAYHLIAESVADEIVSEIKRLSPDANKDFPGFYVEFFFKEKEEREFAAEREKIRKECQDLWVYPDISSLSIETLEKIASKSFDYLKGMDVGYGVYARYRDKQQSQDKLFRDGHQQYRMIISLYHDTVYPNLHSAIKSKDKSTILKALDLFRNYAKEAYIYAKSFDTIAEDYRYIDRAMNQDLTFVKSFCQENKLGADAQATDTQVIKVQVPDAQASNASKPANGESGAVSRSSIGSGQRPGNGENNGGDTVAPVVFNDLSMPALATLTIGSEAQNMSSEKVSKP